MLRSSKTAKDLNVAAPIMMVINCYWTGKLDAGNYSMIERFESLCVNRDNCFI